MQLEMDVQIITSSTEHSATQNSTNEIQLHMHIYSEMDMLYEE